MVLPVGEDTAGGGQQRWRRRGAGGGGARGPPGAQREDEATDAGVGTGTEHLRPGVKPCSRCTEKYFSMFKDLLYRHANS